MPIPRPDNLKPPQFTDQNWVKNGRIDADFHKRRLSIPEFRYIGFERVFAGDRVAAEKRTWHFLWRPPRIEDDETGDSEWNPIRFLGQGTFGKVGLWRRMVEGEVVDEMAIKEADRPDEENRWEVPNHGNISYKGIPTEAALNNDLNRQDASEHIGFLRNFKHYSESGEHGRYRFFFNYCPYDSLYTLAMKYKMWDAWLPELFVWHVFIQLLKGVQTLESSPPEDTLCNVPGTRKTCFLIHLDLKPDNILLDYGADVDHADSSAHYPDVRIADFGVSQYTCFADDQNPDSIDAGTPGYKPPEQTYKHTRWGESFKRPPVDEGKKWSKSHNLWAVGKIMFDIMTHQPSQAVDGMMKNTEEADYRKKHRHFLPEDLADIWLLLAESWLNKARKLSSEAPGAEKTRAAAWKGGGVGETMSDPEHLEQLDDETPDDAESSQEGNEEEREDDEYRKERGEDAKALRMAEQDAALANTEQYQAMVNHWNYSEPLKALVRDLLRPDPKKRPASGSALISASGGRQDYIDSCSKSAPEDDEKKKKSRKKAPGRTNDSPLNLPTPFQPAWKLYYRGNEINDMQAGPGAYEADLNRYQRMVTKSDPDEPLLAPPQDKWQAYIRPLGPPPPMIDIYEGSRRIENPQVALRNPTELSQRDALEEAQVRAAQPTLGLPTQAQYAQLRHTQLAEELVRWTRSPNVIEEAKGVKKTNKVEQPITRLRDLDRKGLRGKHPDELLAFPNAQDVPRGSKRSTIEGSSGVEVMSSRSKRQKREGKKPELAQLVPSTNTQENKGKGKDEPEPRKQHITTEEPEPEEANGGDQIDFRPFQKRNPPISAPRITLKFQNVRHSARDDSNRSGWDGETSSSGSDDEIIRNEPSPHLRGDVVSNVKVAGKVTNAPVRRVGLRSQGPPTSSKLYVTSTRACKEETSEDIVSSEEDEGLEGNKRGKKKSKVSTYGQGKGITKKPKAEAGGRGRAQGRGKGRGAGKAGGAKPREVDGESEKAAKASKTKGGVTAGRGRDTGRGK